MSNTMTKRDRGAVLFQTFFNQLRGDFERLDGGQLKALRALGEMKRILNVLEETVKLHGKVLFEEEPKVKFSCIACDHTFDLSLPEAQAQNFTSICPKCHNWGLPLREGGDYEYSPVEIAEVTGFAHGTVCRVIRELGLNPGGKRHRLFRKEEFKKIEAVLQKKTSRVKKLIGGSNESYVKN